MATSGTKIARSGWLYRQSSVLKKWRRYFFALTVEGVLRYFETEFETKAEDAMLVPAECTAIRIGTSVVKVKPPEGYSEKCLLSVDTSSGKSWNMCGESEDDVKAWQLALEEARHIMHQVRSASAPPGVVAYGYPPQSFVYYDDMYGRYGYQTQSVTYTNAPRVVYTNYPGQVVIYERGRRGYSNYCGPLGGAATGLIAGAALGSLLWTPFVFASPFLWC